MTQGSSQQLGWYQWAPQTPSQTRIEFKDSTSQLTKTARSLDLNLALSGARLSLSALKRRSVAVFGLGAVGGEILTALARLGVGRLIGIDAGRYREDSWRTQPVFPEHGGQTKAWVQGLRARRHNPAGEVWAAIGRAQDLPLSVLRKVDVFVTAGDNLELPVWAGNMAAALGKEALVQGAVHGPTWTAICRTYNLASVDSPCPGCMLRSKEWGTSFRSLWLRSRRRYRQRLCRRPRPGAHCNLAGSLHNSRPDGDSRMPQAASEHRGSGGAIGGNHLLPPDPSAVAHHPAPKSELSLCSRAVEDP